MARVKHNYRYFHVRFGELVFSESLRFFKPVITRPGSVVQNHHNAFLRETLRGLEGARNSRISRKDQIE